VDARVTAILKPPTPEEAAQELMRRRAARGSLYEFLQQAWPQWEGARPFIGGWAIGAIAEHVQAVVEGQIRDLLINQPPRTSKPVWEEEWVQEKNRGRIKLKDVQVGDHVLTHKGRFCRVSEVHQQGIKPLLKIGTFYGRHVKAAPDHPFYTPNGWIEAQNLTLQDLVGVVHPIEDSGTEELTAEAARWLGYMIGDGSCTGTQKGFTNGDEAVLADFEHCSRNLGFFTTRSKKAFCNAEHIRVKAHPKRWTGKGKIESPLTAFMKKHGIYGKSSYEKNVPPAVLASSDKIIGEFIGAYWSCDGHVAKRPYSRNGAIRRDFAIGCNSVNRDLLVGIQHLMTRLGISTYLRKKTAKIKTKRQNSDVYVSYGLFTGSFDEVGKFAARVPMVHTKRFNNLSGVRRDDFDRVLTSDPVVSIEPAGEGACRCLTVECDGSFTVNDIAVHNSSLVSVALVPWAWIDHPQLQFMYVSYSDKLSGRDHVRSRRVLESEWYQRRWGSAFTLALDQNTKVRFDNTAGGYRVTSSITGTVTGEGADIFCLPYDSMVETESGPMMIGDIVANRRAVNVWSFNEKSKSRELMPVIDWHTSRAQSFQHIQVNDGPSLLITDNHSVYDNIAKAYVRADVVRPGDMLRNLDGPVLVTEITRVGLSATADTYNISVANNRNYYANGILVHNCLDDPNSASDVSEAGLDVVQHFWEDVMPTRLNDFRTGRRIVVQQRIHEKDLSGIITSAKDNGWVHLRLPMEFEPGSRCVTVVLPSTNGKKWRDPRKEENDLLWPERVGRPELDRLKRELRTEYNISGQLQQRPAPGEGGIIKRKWFRLWTQEATPKLDYIIQSWDTALSEKKEAAFNACTTWGVFKDQHELPNMILLAAWRKRCEYNELREHAKRLSKNYLDDGDLDKPPKPAKRALKPDMILVEDKTTGKILIRDLQRAGVTVAGFNPDRYGDKTQRVRFTTPTLESGHIWVPGLPPDFTRPRHFADVALSQFASFPKGASRDLVDTMTQAIIRAQESGWVWRSDDANAPPPDEVRDIPEAIYG